MPSAKADAIMKLTILLGELAADSQRREEPEITYIETLIAMRDDLDRRIVQISRDR